MCGRSSAPLHPGAKLATVEEKPSAGTVMRQLVPLYEPVDGLPGQIKKRGGIVDVEEAVVMAPIEQFGDPQSERWVLPALSLAAGPL